MTPKRMLTIAGVWYLLEGATAFFTGIGFDFMSYGFGILGLSLGILFLAARDELASKLRIVVFCDRFPCDARRQPDRVLRPMERTLHGQRPRLCLSDHLADRRRRFFHAGRDNTATRIRRLN